MSDDRSNAYPYPMSGLAMERGAEMIDLTALIMMLRRRFRLLVSVAALVFVAVLLLYLVQRPTYTATSQVQITTEKPNVIAPGQEVMAEDQPTTFAIDTQAEVLKSRDLAQRVVRKLGLERNPQFVSAEALGGPAAEQEATNTLLKNLSVKRSGVAFAIDVSYSSPDPKTAALVSNTFADQYLARQLELKRTATQTATSWLGERLNTLRGEVLQAEAAVQQYRAANGLINTARDEIGAQQELSRMTVEIATAQADLAEKQAAAATARAQARGVMSGQDVSDALNSDVIVQLRRQRAEIIANVSQMETRYGPRHPDLLQARNQLAAVNAQIQDEVNRIISGVEGQARISAGRVASLQGSLNRTRAELAANSAASVRLNELERNAEAVRSLYEGYLARYRQTSTQQDLSIPEARILTRAVAPTAPSAPKLAVFLAIAIAGGVAAGVISMVLAELLDGSLRTPDAVQQKLGLRTLASVPAAESVFAARGVRLEAGQVIPEQPFSAFAESLRMLRAALTNVDGAQPQIVAITSALPDEGKSTVAVCLAQVAAMGGEKVILVQCDVRRAQRGDGTRSEVGLLEVLAGQAPLEAALRTDPNTGLVTLPVSRQATAPADAVAGAAMDELLARLRPMFNLIILDTAPVLAIAETLLIARKADATCFLVRWGKTSTSAAETGVQLLAEAGVNVAGAVLSRVDLRKQANWSRNDRSAYFEAVRAYYS